jgi:hypothetical protein
MMKTALICIILLAPPTYAASPFKTFKRLCENLVQEDPWPYAEYADSILIWSLSQPGPHDPHIKKELDYRLYAGRLHGDDEKAARELLYGNPDG